MTAPISLRAYAKHRGMSVASVSKAYRAGRLPRSVAVVDGKPHVIDVDLADQEWQANTRPRVDRPAKQALPKRRKARARKTEIEVPAYDVSRALREAHAARREGALADLAEIEVAEKHEELVPIDEARAYMIDKFTIVKTRILGVPSGVAQRLPHLADEITPVLDMLLREILDELSAEDDGDEEAEEDC